MKIAIIGAGNMGGATARGLVEKEALKPEEITVTAAHFNKLESLQALGMNTTLNNIEAVEDKDLVILAVKPWIGPKVIEEIKSHLKKGCIVVSMMAGIKGEDLRDMLSPAECEISIVIPNTAISLGESMTFHCPINTSEESTKLITSLFENLGEVYVCDEAHLSAGTALASCGIAFAMRYVRAAVEGGVELGIRANEGQQIVAQTLIGAAKLLLQPNAHAEAEIDKVTTPGGITIKGLNAMEKEGFTNAVIAGLLATGKNL